jgi:hypothetical protein
MTRKNEAGQALVFGVLALSLLLMGFAGLGIDMGYMRYEKRLQQSAADSAAIAGASNLTYTGVALAAQNAATANGFPVFPVASTSTGCPPAAPAAGVGSVSVTVNSPPCSGPHNGNANYVEVYVAKRQPVIFMSILGVKPQVVTARAVATAHTGTVPNGCLYTLGPPTSSGVEGVNLTGHAYLNGPSCGMVDNGNYDPTGNITVIAGTFGVAGSDTGKGGSVTCYAQSSSNCPSYGEPAASDPMSSLKAPSQPGPSASCPAKGACNLSTSGTQTLQPGTYSSIDFGKNSVTTLSPGIYYIDGTGGLTFEGKAQVMGSGVMFYLTCPPGTSPCSNGATLNAVGGGNVPDIQLTAPTPTNCPACPPATDGTLFYQDANDTNPPSFGGDNNTTLYGVLYFPSVQLSFFGNDSFSAGMVVAKAVALTGNPTVTLTGPGGLPSGVTVVENAVLVE